MRIEKQRTDGVLVLSVRGKLDTGRRVEKFRQALDDVVAQGHLRLVLDFERMRHVTQPGLDALLHCLQTVRCAGGDLKLAAVSRRLSGVCTTSGLLRIFDVYNSVGDAVNAFEPAERPALHTSSMPRWRFVAQGVHLSEADTVRLG